MRQLDLFHDSPRTITLNMLREAVLARNAPGAGTALERLLNLAPGHEMASDAGTLLAVLDAPAPDGPSEGIEWLHALEREWRPAAIRLLGTGGGRDFLAPVWRCIGAALGPSIPSIPNATRSRKLQETVQLNAGPVGESSLSTVLPSSRELLPSPRPKPT